MTFREKWIQEHPGEDIRGAITHCPPTFGYEDRTFQKQCPYLPINCTQCWDREIPEEQTSAANEPVIKDSCDRTEFESGAVRDMREGKGRCDLIPLEVVAKFLRLGQYAPDPQRAEDSYWLLWNIEQFKMSNYSITSYLYSAMGIFNARAYDYTPTMFLEVSKHFEEGAKKYGENNWQKGIPVSCYIDSAVRHYLKWLRGDSDEPHDRAFVWNLMCCIWEVDYREKKEETNNGKTDI